jgi:5-methylcytosine-specific restriction protein A
MAGRLVRVTARAASVCAEPGCPEIVVGRRRCPDHPRSDSRPSASARGYDVKWRRNSARFLKAHPVCVDCGAPATDADHDPVTRVELVRRGDPHPDAWHHLVARCHPCHSRKTATRDRAGR